MDFFQNGRCIDTTISDGDLLAAMDSTTGDRGYVSKRALLAALGARVDRRGLCIGLGDSHIEGSTLQGTPTDWRTLKNYPLGSSIYARVIWHAGGRLMSLGNYGIGGQTAAQIAARLPEVVNTGAGTAIVCAGTNDARQLRPLTETLPALELILSSLRNAGIDPVVIELPPLGTPPDNDTIRARQDQINHWLRNHCAINGYLFVGINHLIMDPANRQWLAGMNHNNDGVHLSGVACDICGKAVADAISGVSAGVRNHLVTSNIDAYNMVSNALGLTDVTADGIPDGWSTLGVPAGGTAVHTLETVAGWPGKALCIEQQANTNTRQLYQAWNTTQGGGWAVGEMLRVGIRWKVTGSGAPGAFAQLSFTGSTTGQTLYRLFATGETSGDQVSVLPDVRIPEGTTLVNLNLGIAAGTGKVFFNAPTLMNVTRNGV